MYIEFLLGFLIFIVYIIVERLVVKLCRHYLNSRSSYEEKEYKAIELACQEVKTQNQILSK